jgi:glycosyltransferase involved in cell wall biosynthesis
MNILIVGVHQTYLKAYAGGYVRLREFLKRMPREFDYKLIDINPSIYRDIADSRITLLFNNLKFVQIILKIFFPLGVVCEWIWVGLSVHRILKSNINNGEVLIYLPFDHLHLYLPAILLKKKYPQIKVLVDILNFKVVKENIFQITKKQNKNSNIVISFFLAILYKTVYIIFKNTINNVDYVFGVSRDQVNEIKKIYKRNTIDYTPSGVSIDCPITKDIKGKYLGVYMGRVTEQKGIYNLLKVWKEVIKNKPDVRLAIMGPIDSDTRKNVERQINNCELKNNIEIFGPVSEEKKVRILSESQIFLHLANFEPLFPVIGILEGLACGLPCLVFEMPVLSAEVDKNLRNKTIFVVNNGDIKGAAKSILEFDDYSEAKKNKISIQAKKFASKFDWNIISNKEFNVIRRLIR